MVRALPNLARVERLRELFLEERRSKRALTDYWRDRKDVDAYDAVLAARIGWKWNAALEECRDRGFARADDAVVLDFGCGSGIAARRFAAHFGAKEVVLHDRSSHAMAFAKTCMELELPKVKVRNTTYIDKITPDVLLVSHVLAELDAEGEAALEALMRRSRRVIVVEPGNRVVSRRLSELRSRVLDDFSVTAPCPHQAACPSLVERNDWCHFFATPPPEVFTDGFWARVARELSIDLRSLPYAFLALEREQREVAAGENGVPERLLGRAEMTKHVARMRSCREDGLASVEITKRHDKLVWRALKKRPERVRTVYQEVEAARNRDEDDDSDE